VLSAGEIYVYVGFFVTLVAAGLGFPAPEEIVISGAGVMAGRVPSPPPRLVPEDVAALFAPAPDGSLGGYPWVGLNRCFPPPPDALPPVRWWILLPVCIAGVVLSDIFLYGMGRFWGDRLLQRRWMARIVPPGRRQRIEDNFHQYGVGILIFGRLVPGIRAPLFLTAGSMRLPLARFLFADGIGAVVGNSLFFFLGYWLGDSFSRLVGAAVGEAEKFRPILIVTILGLIVAYLLWHFLRHPVSTGDPQEVPLIGPQVASHMEQADSNVDHQPACDKPAEKKATTPEDST
jgi:membrane protein DedA with SNARE-associated domain